jgi:hypothetical protein
VPRAPDRGRLPRVGPITRANDATESTFGASFDRGGLALLVHPAYVDDPRTTGAGVKAVLDQVVHTLAPGTPRMTPIAVAAMPIAEDSAGARFARDDGSGLAGEARVFFSQGWYIAVIAMGQPGSARPEGAAGSGFLAASRTPTGPPAPRPDR